MKKFLGLLLLSVGAANAGVSVSMPSPLYARFKVQAAIALYALEKSPDHSIRRLHREATRSPQAILIHPITRDRRTWHDDGDRLRAHTEPVLKRKLKDDESIDEPVGAIVFLPPAAVNPKSPYWSGGVFVHELVHAVDLAYGRYHSDYRIRERRAVVLQNLWRDRHDHDLRDDYHDRFKTRDYQDAVRSRALKPLIDHIFRHADLPSSRR